EFSARRQSVHRSTQRLPRPRPPRRLVALSEVLEKRPGDPAPVHPFARHPGQFEKHGDLGSVVLGRVEEEGVEVLLQRAREAELPRLGIAFFVDPDADGFAHVAVFQAETEEGFVERQAFHDAPYQSSWLISSSRAMSSSTARHSSRPCVWTSSSSLVRW